MFFTTSDAQSIMDSIKQTNKTTTTTKKTKLFKKCQRHTLGPPQVTACGNLPPTVGMELPYLFWNDILEDENKTRKKTCSQMRKRCSIQSASTKTTRMLMKVWFGFTKQPEQLSSLPLLSLIHISEPTRPP